MPFRPRVNHDGSDDDSSVENIPAPPARRRPVATSVSTNSVSATSTLAALSTSGTQDTSAITRVSIRRRQALGGFVWDTTARIGIRDSTRATSLTGILQLAEAHPQGYMGSIANTSRGAWFAANADILFQDDGPLGTFTPIRHQMLQRHFGVALRQARVYYTQQHSSEQSGADEEEIPAWARRFFRFFEVLDSNPSASAQAAELATNRRVVVNSIMGRQATLGPHQGTHPVQLRTETRVSNVGNESVRRVQQRVGNFETETLDENAMRERLVEGVDDAVIRRPAQRQRTSQQNGIRRRNRHDPSADMNLPNSRYFDVSNAFQHLGSLTDAVAQAFVNPPPLPPRTMLDIMNDFIRASDQLYVDEQRNFAMGITFWTNVLNNLVVEQANHAAIGSSNVSPTEPNDDDDDE